MFVYFQSCLAYRIRSTKCTDSSKQAPFSFEGACFHRCRTSEEDDWQTFRGKEAA